MREWFKIDFRQRMGESGESCREVNSESGAVKLRQGIRKRRGIIYGHRSDGDC